MNKRIFLFELRYRFANPITYLILLMMAGQGIWYAYGLHDHYTSDEALMNGAGLFGNRYLTHIVAIGYYLFMIISFDIGLIEQIRFGYALTPGLEDYSEIMGYGIWERASFWFFLMWTALAVFLVLGGIQLWRRGVAQPGVFKLKRLVGKELSFGAKIAGAATMVVFILLQAYIVVSTTHKRNYIPGGQADAEAARYEKVYGAAANANQFAKQVHEVHFDLYPGQRKAEYAALLSLTNVSQSPVDRLYLNVDAHTRLSLVTLDNRPLKRLDRNIELGMSVYKLPEPLNPGEKAQFSLEGVRQYRGFTTTAETPQADLAHNGLFITDPILFIGFDPDKFLRDNRARKIFNLDKLASRLPPPNAPYGLSQGFVSPWMRPDNGQKVNITVSTTAGQQPFAPGKLIRSWQEFCFFPKCAKPTTKTGPMNLTWNRLC